MMKQSLQIRRLTQQFKTIEKEQSENYYAAPLKDDLHVWHFTIRGPPDTEYEKGVYHGKIIFPAQYPLKAPDLTFFTHNGRFQVNQSICLSITKFHQEEWNPAWTLRTMLQAIISMFPVKQTYQGVGSINYSKGQCIRLANESHSFICDHCGPVNKILPTPKKSEEIKMNEKDIKKLNDEENEKTSQTIRMFQDILDVKRKRDEVARQIMLQQHFAYRQEAKLKGYSHNSQEIQSNQTENTYGFKYVEKQYEIYQKVLKSFQIISKQEREQEEQRKNPSPQKSSHEDMNESIINSGDKQENGGDQSSTNFKYHHTSAEEIFKQDMRFSSLRQFDIMILILSFLFIYYLVWAFML